MRILSYFILFIFLCGPVYAQENKQDNKSDTLSVPKGQFDDLKFTGSGRVDKIIDGLTILLKDKTILRLASLDIPDFNIWEHAIYSEEALKLLQKTLPEGTEIMIYQTRMAKKGRLNRMNHELGHIVTKKDDVWIQGLLLSHGLARVYTASNAPEMVDQMFKIEQMARQGEKGMWGAESEFPLLAPDTASQAIGNLAIVEGTIRKTATVRNNIYLNFGDDWKTDFTVMLSPEVRKKLSHRNINALDMTNKSVRVRGFIREYNGPLIELEAPEHLEYPLLPPTDEKPILEANP
ncbi:MAG: thermonuclease family protein [Alphaproteobacteria bacterium]|nr:thermonuclease family protein [Alphaproteobacteria bacterium]